MAEKKDAPNEGKKPSGDQQNPEAAAAAAEEEAKKKAKPGEGEAGADADAGGEGEAENEGGEGEQDDDWRVAWADGDAKVLERLKRYESPQSAARALVLAQDKLREKGGITPPKPDAPVEEKAKFYTEHMGRPAKLEDVKIHVNLPEGVEALPPEVMETVTGVTGELHKAGIFGEEQMAFAQQVIADQYLGVAKELEGAATAFRDKSTETLKKKWGRDFEENVNLAASYCAMRCEEAGVDRRALAHIKLANGALLGDDPLFMQVMAKGGRDYAEDPMMNREVDGGPRSSDLQDALDKEMAKANGSAADRKYYDSPEGKTRRAALRKNLKRLGGAGAAKKR